VNKLTKATFLVILGAIFLGLIVIPFLRSPVIKVAVYEFGMRLEVDDESFTIYADEGIPIRRKLHLMNRTQSHNFALLFFVDYEQSRFTLGGSDSLIHQLTLNPFEERIFEIELPSLDKGVHPAFFAVVMNPDDHSLSEAARLMNFTSLLSFKMAVGEPSSALATTNECPSAFVKGYKSNSSLSTGIFIVKQASEGDWELLFQEEVKAGDNFEAYIVIKNDEPESKSYAILLLWDWEQIPIQDPTQDQVIYSQLDGGEEAAIPLKLKVANSTPHELSALLISDPCALTTPQLEYRASNRLTILAD